MRLLALMAAIALAASMLFAAVPLAQADDPQPADGLPVWVGGEQMHSSVHSYSFGDGTVTFDYSTGTLTLENATIPVAAGPTEWNKGQLANVNAGILAQLDKPLHVVLVGENKIVYDGSTLNGECVAGIYTTPGGSLEGESADLFIEGEGSLSIELAGIPDFAGENVSDYASSATSAGSPSELCGIQQRGIMGLTIDGANISIDLGTPGVFSAVRSYGIQSQYITITDADIEFDGATAVQERFIFSMITRIDGASRINAVLADGSSESCGFVGTQLIVTGDTQLSSTAGKAIVYSHGLSVGNVEFSGNAQVTMDATGILDVESPAAYRTASGVNAGGLTVKDNAVLTMLGADRAYAGSDPKLSDHEVGGALVSGTYDILPVDVAQWDGETPFTTENDGVALYKYIRIPGTPEAAADIAAAGAVLDMIEALPEPEEATEDDKEAVEKAWEAFENLTDEQELLLPEDAVEKLATLYDELRDPEVVRIAGDYANETAAAISAYAFPEGSEYVVIARDDDFADALGATGLAGTLGCPIVLTGREGLSEAAAAEVERLGASKAYIIGGTGAIKDQVDADLKALGVDVEPRVWGENSYDTSLACAKLIVELGGSSERAVVAMSMNFQDALSISPIAYREKLPLVLQTWGDTSAERGFTDEAKGWLAGKSLVVAGGVGAISDESLDGLRPDVRLWGEDGYETSNKIAVWATGEEGLLSDRAAVFACGAQAPKGVDALAGAALAGRIGCPVLLVNGNEEIEGVNTYTVDNYFAAHAKNCKDVYILGGEYVMPPSLVDKIEALLG